MCTLFHAFLKKSFSLVIKIIPESIWILKNIFLGLKKKEKAKYINCLAKFMSEFNDLIKIYNEGTF